MIGIAEGRPPYVRFETQGVLNRNRSEKSGHVEYDNVDMAIVTPAGSKDEYIKIAVEWIAQIKRDALNNRYPPAWAQRFEMAYQEWKKGNEISPDGSPIQHWPVATPAEIKHCLACNVRTVEDLSQLPETGLQMLGMGGRVLRDKARAWLQSANDHGKLAERIAALEAANRDKDETIERQNEKIAKLSAALNIPKRGPGRPRKEAA